MTTTPTQPDLSSTNERQNSLSLKNDQIRATTPTKEEVIKAMLAAARNTHFNTGDYGRIKAAYGTMYKMQVEPLERLFNERPRLSEYAKEGTFWISYHEWADSVNILLYPHTKQENSK